VTPKGNVNQLYYLQGSSKAFKYIDKIERPHRARLHAQMEANDLEGVFASRLCRKGLTGFVEMLNYLIDVRTVFISQATKSTPTI
jgi:hypothetical protein